MYFLNKKILILDLPFLCYTDKICEEKQYYNLNKKLCSQFGFNYINLREYYKFNDLEEFGRWNDGGGHEFEFVMRELGKNIIENIDNFKKPKELNIKNDNPKFEICTPKDMELISGNLQEIPIKNSMFNENIFRINNETKLKFPTQFNNYQILGFHSWNHEKERENDFVTPKDWGEMIGTYSSIVLKNQEKTITKEMAFLAQFISINSIDFKIDNDTFMINNKK